MEMTPLTLALVTIGAAAVLLLLSLFLTPTARSVPGEYNRATRLFLVLLRLAIGWHFLVEGIDKWEDPNWTSENYLRAATGPLALKFRAYADEPILDRLTLGPDNTFPPALERDWQRYLEEFKQAFNLNEQQSSEAQKKLLAAKDRTLKWLQSEQPVQFYSPYLPREQNLTVAQRIDAYQQALQKVQEVTADNIALYGEGASDQLANALNEANQIIRDLKMDLQKQNERMINDLKTVLDSEQQRFNLPEMPKRPMSEWYTLDWADNIVRYGLCVVGMSLIVGLFTRLGCFLGAVLVAMFYIAMIPIPGWPESARAEGHYIYLNKNVIEMLALLALSTTASGKWLGLDGVLQFIWPFRRKEKLAP